jgi:uncharacterized protein YndB with AHSA1/START domain
MNAITDTSPETLQIATPTDTTIVLTRSFNAPRRLVWDATFTPDRMRRWMLPPPGLTMTLCTCEPHVGGALEIAWKSDEADPAITLRGTFTEVVLHEYAIHTETMALGSGQTIESQLEKHEFAEQGGVTVLTVTQTYDSKDDRDGALASGMDRGMEACYRQLDAMLADPA